MLMQRLIVSVPLWLLVLCIIAILELYSVGLMRACRKKWGPDLLKLNNEVAGFKFSVIGVLYAVMLGFLVVAVWQNYNATEITIRNEAKAVGGLTQLSYALPEEEGEVIRAALSDYVNDVRQTEWSTMARGLPSKTTADALAHLSQAVFGVRAEQLRDHALFQQGLHLLGAIEDSRSERLDSSDGSVPTILWIVLSAGALITLGYPAFFGTSNAIAQTLMTAALAALVALALAPAMILDFPFSGEAALTSGDFDEALRLMPPHQNGHSADRN
jgi:hypothetical protein